MNMPQTFSCERFFLTAAAVWFKCFLLAFLIHSNYFLISLVMTEKKAKEFDFLKIFEEAHALAKERNYSRNVDALLSKSGAFLKHYFSGVPSWL